MPTEKDDPIYGARRRSSAGWPPSDAPPPSTGPRGNLEPRRSPPPSPPPPPPPSGSRRELLSDMDFGFLLGVIVGFVAGMTTIVIVLSHSGRLT